MEVLVETDITGVKVFSKGKVRDLYDLDDKLLMVTTDRISAFDCVLPDGIPYKGKVLLKLSEWWFHKTEDIISNHVVSTDVSSFPGFLQKYRKTLDGRSMLVKKARRIPAECVVRGYLAGSAYKEYRQKGSVCGIRLPGALKEAEKLDEPIFTPATKASSGHDMNITLDELAGAVGSEAASKLKEKSIRIYLRARDLAESKGIMISDTKMEFGFLNGEIILIDELLTPDSSRFWPREDYKLGGAQKSFDKQYVRDYLEGLNWDKTPPAPSLPQEIIKKTSEKYLEAYRRITGKDLIQS